MIDLIDRQAAINALGERPLIWSERGDEYELGQCVQWDADVLAIECVPSAQPEIIQCKDCDNSDFSGCSGATCYCTEHGKYMFEWDWCSRGERIANENDRR